MQRTVGYRANGNRRVPKGTLGYPSTTTGNQHTRSRGSKSIRRVLWI